MRFKCGWLARGLYHVSTLTAPDRIVIDVSHATSKVISPELARGHSTA